MVSLLPPGLHAWTITWTISSELLSFFPYFLVFSSAFELKQIYRIINLLNITSVEFMYS